MTKSANEKKVRKSINIDPDIDKQLAYLGIYRRHQFSELINELLGEYCRTKSINAITELQNYAFTEYIHDEINASIAPLYKWMSAIQMATNLSAEINAKSFADINELALIKKSVNYNNARLKIGTDPQLQFMGVVKNEPTDLTSSEETKVNDNDDSSQSSSFNF